MLSDCGPRVPLVASTAGCGSGGTGRYTKRDVWLHEYQTLSRQQAELESAIFAFLTTPSSTPAAGAPASLTSHLYDDTAGGNRWLTQLSSTQASLLESHSVARAALRETKERLSGDVRVARTSMQNALLGLSENALRDTGGLLPVGPASAATLLSSLPTAKARARADYSALTAALRGNLQAEAHALSVEASHLDTDCEEATVALLQQLGERMGDSRLTCEQPPTTVYTGVCYREELEAVEEQYAAFLHASGGPTLGWSDEMHDAFLRIAHKVEREGLPVASQEPLFLSAPSPPVPLPLLEAAKRWFYTMVPVPEIERHVELYTRQQELLQARLSRLEMFQLSQLQEERGPGRQYSGSPRALVLAQATQQQGQQLAIPVCEAPWERGHTTTKEAVTGKLSLCGFHDPDLQAAVYAKIEAVRRTERERAEARKRVEGWKAQKNAEKQVAEMEARRAAAAARRAKKESFKAFQEAQLRGDRLGWRPRGGNDKKAGSAAGSMTDRAGELADSETQAAPDAAALQQRETKRLQKEALAERHRRDLEETKARRERIDAARSYEVAHTKAAVSARYLRVVALARNSADVECPIPCDGFTRPPAMSQSRAIHTEERHSCRYRDATATRTQHVLPDWEEARREEKMGLRAQWLSPASRELYGALGAV